MDEELIRIALVACSVVFLVGTIFFLSFSGTKSLPPVFQKLARYSGFFYVCFLKPHTGSGTAGQQDALESFYKLQV